MQHEFGIYRGPAGSHSLAFFRDVHIPVVVTFGLLLPNKDIEHVIEALPNPQKKHPNVVYIVLGATHPNLLAHEGESYRLMLEDRGVAGNVANVAYSCGTLIHGVRLVVPCGMSDSASTEVTCDLSELLAALQGS